MRCRECHSAFSSAAHGWPGRDGRDLPSQAWLLAQRGQVDGKGWPSCADVAYTEDGQLLTGSYMDYGIPRADDLPDFGFASHPSPCRTNPLGAKGCGEAGCAGSLPAVMNAIVDALADDPGRSR